jgi:hypothetical protein
MKCLEVARQYDVCNKGTQSLQVGCQVPGDHQCGSNVPFPHTHTVRALDSTRTLTAYTSVLSVSGVFEGYQRLKFTDSS